LDPETIKSRYFEAKKKFLVLLRCTAILKNETLELIFNKDEFKNASNATMNELLAVWKEVKGLNPRGVKAIGLNLYERCVQKLKITYD